MPSSFCIPAESKSAPTSGGVTDKVMELLGHVPVIRRTVDRFNPAEVVVAVFLSVLPEALTYYRQKYPVPPDFLVVDWKGDDKAVRAQRFHANARLIPIRDKQLVGPRSLCLFPKPTRTVLDPQGLNELLQAVLSEGFGPQVLIEAATMRGLTRWRPNPGFIAARREDIGAIYEALADEESRENFLRAIKAIATGDAGYLNVSPYEQYQHPLVRPAHGDVMVEGGVLNGYTTNKFAAQIGEEGKIIAFEPLAEAHRVSLAATAHHPNVIIEHLGLWSKKSAFYIENRGGGSHLVSAPNANTETCYCVDLDTYAKENRLEACDIIKLDIEGAEEECIKGALETIRQHRPKLQIALYHTPAHYLDIILMLMRENVGYKFYLGHHLAWYWETILYALPDRSGREADTTATRPLQTTEGLDHESFLRVFQKAPVQEISHQCSTTPVVSVVIPTYNHARFLPETLDSILAQKVDFPIEICVGEDNSTDESRAICLSYAEKYPQKIRLLLGARANNIAVNGKPTGRFNLTNMILGARGRYIALCEGDDHWSDPDKLAKQVAFLDANEEFSACFHNGQVVWDDSGKRLPYITERKAGELPPSPGNCFRVVDRTEFATPDLLNPFTFIPTASLMFRASCLRRVPAWFFKVLSADIAIASLLSREGKKIKFLNFDGCVYRKHDGGITHGETPLSIYFDRKLLYTYLNQVHEYRFDREFSALVEVHRKVTIQWLSSQRTLTPSLMARAQRFVATEGTAIASLRGSAK
jgi:FkbM family methyltransferase